MDDLVEELPGTVSTRVVAKDVGERHRTRSWLSKTHPPVDNVGCPRWCSVYGLDSGRERDVRFSLTHHRREEARHS